MGKKFYAVQQGRVPGVYQTWEECKAQVHGYSGAVYKSFPTAEEARGYVTGQNGIEGSVAPTLQDDAENDMGTVDCGVVGTEAVNAGRESFGIVGTGTVNVGGGHSGVAGIEASDCGVTESAAVGSDAGEQLVAYVDGSYYSATGEFSYGVVILQNGSEYCFNEKLSDPNLASMHNVAGEIKGAEAAMRYAVEHGYQQITIYHDYEGIARWCTGDWKANKAGTKAYKAYYDSISDRLQVRFEKVKGHSGDKYNDMADRLAKQALGI